MSKSKQAGIGVGLVRKANSGLLMGRSDTRGTPVPVRVAEVVRQSRVSSQRIEEAGRRALKEAHKDG